MSSLLIFVDENKIIDMSFDEMMKFKNQHNLRNLSMEEDRILGFPQKYGCIKYLCDITDEKEMLHLILKFSSDNIIIV